MPMGKVTVIPKGAMACCLKFDAQFSLPISGLNIPPGNIQASVHNPITLWTIKRITICLGGSISSDIYSRAFSIPPRIIPELGRVFMKKTTLITIGAFLPIIILLAQLHLLYDFLVIIPISGRQPLLIAQSNKLLPVRRWLPHVLNPMCKVAIFTVSTSPNSELCTHASLEENVAGSLVNTGVLSGPWRAWHCIRVVVITNPCPLERRGLILRWMWLQKWLQQFVVIWELKPHFNGICVCGEWRWWHHKGWNVVRETHHEILINSIKSWFYLDLILSKWASRTNNTLIFNRMQWVIKWSILNRK